MLQEREMEAIHKSVLVRFRLWDGGNIAPRYSSPSELYTTARDAFSHTRSLQLEEFTLYLLPDVKDISTRVKIDREYPFTQARLILGSPPCLVLMHIKNANDNSPSRLPAVLDDGAPEIVGSSDSSGGGRGPQQSEFRREVMKASSWRDYFTGETIQKSSGETGKPGEACHIIPVRKGSHGTLEQRCDLLKSRGQQPNLYITANGIPLLTDFHNSFDNFDLSVDPDNDFSITVWNLDAAPPLVSNLHGKKAALRNCSWIAAKPLLRWHHEQCATKSSLALAGTEVARVRQKQKHSKKKS
jgi:hypothetical protein